MSNSKNFHQKKALEERLVQRQVVVKPLADDRLGNLEETDVYDPQKCEIYFSQLGMLIDDHWNTCFKNIFSKNKNTIKAFFTLINALRLECHAAPVTDEEMQNFRGIITQLEKEVSNCLD